MVLRIDVPIDLRDGIETLKTCITLAGWQTLDRRADETILERLHEPQLISLEWATKRQPRSECFDSTPFVTAPTESREKALRLNIELVCARTRRNRSYAAGEFAILSRIGISEHLHRFNCFNWQIERE